MTKEELKKEAIKYAVDYPTSYGKGYKHKDLRIAYLAGAEPREKQIQIDAEQIRALQKQNGELTDKVKELEAQIDKMKVCQNCSNWNWKHNKCEKKLKGDCFKYSKWVMRNF